MKYSLIIMAVLGVCFSPAANAQNFNEWFRQKKTQKQYLLQQIAALQVYKGAIKKGYHIVEDGLNLISDVQDGEFSLHKDYFDRLNRVSPYVKQYPKIAAISKCYKNIYQIYQQSEKMAASTKSFSAQEHGAMRNIWERVIDNCHLLIAEMEKICTDGTLGMSDSQRTEHIDKIFLEMESNLAFAHSFSTELLTIKQGRNQAEKDIRVMRSLNGLK
ncbi:hypothetical protein [Sphingobacterium faecium]|uniref:hypothetical protein n=1 Tax=Sphingobacterium faecium TaxID=34087 RepID=UPI00320A5C47